MSKKYLVPIQLPADPVNALEAATKQYVDAKATSVSTWTAVTYQNGWADYGLGFQVAQYRKVGDEVQLRGLIKGPALNQVIFTLPTGFRPPAPVIWGVAGTDAFAELRLAADGTLQATVGSAAWITLDSLRFSVST